MNRKKTLLLCLALMLGQSLKSEFLFFGLSAAALIGTLEVTRFFYKDSSDPLLSYAKIKKEIKNLKKEFLQISASYGAQLYIQQKGREEEFIENKEWEDFEDFTKKNEFKKLLKKFPEDAKKICDDKGEFEAKKLEQVNSSKNIEELRNEYATLKQQLADKEQQCQELKKSLPEEYLIQSNAQKIQKSDYLDLRNYIKELREKGQLLVVMGNKSVPISALENQNLDQAFSITSLKQRKQNLIEKKYSEQAGISFLVFKNISQPLATICSGIDQKRVQQQKYEALLDAKSDIGIPHLLNNDHE